MYIFSLVPNPTAVLTSDNVTVGSDATLTCTVTLPNFNTYMSIQSTLTVTVELRMGSMTVMTNSTPSGSGAVRTSVFTLSNVGVSNAGQYQCRATVSSTDSNVVDSNAVVSDSASLTVQGRSLDHSVIFMCYCFHSTCSIGYSYW